MGKWILHALILGMVALSATAARAQQDGACATWSVTAFSREQFPGIMRAGIATAGQVGTAVAVGVDGQNRPLLPLGSTVWIEGLGARQVLDTGLGGAGWLDILVDATAEARNWGRRAMTVCH